MDQKKKIKLQILFLMIASFFGLINIVMIIAFPPFVEGDLTWRRTVIGSIYALLCTLGISAAFFPKKCSGRIDIRKRNDLPTKNPYEYNSRIFGLIIVHGHHPNCEKFFDHEFKLRKKTFCAGCLGFSLGALISLVGTMLYFFGGLQIRNGNIFIGAVGIFGVALGLIQSPIFNVKGFLRVFPNAFFIIGTFLTLVVVDTAVHSLFVDLFLILLSVFWLLTRISLSQWKHAKICQTCGSNCLNQISSHKKN